MKYFIYIVRCCDNSLYTGITTDLQRRFNEHCTSPLGAKYTKTKKPLRIERAWQTNNRSNASKLEARIKKLTKAQKEELIKAPQNFNLYFNTLDESTYILLGEEK